MILRNFTNGCENDNFDIVKENYKAVKEKSMAVYSWGVKCVVLSENINKENKIKTTKKI